MTDQKIRLNAIKCKKCGDVRVSLFTHDLQKCSCGAVFVDGGQSYCRRGGRLEDLGLATEEEAQVEADRRKEHGRE